MKECFNTLDKLASEFSYRNIYSIMTEYGDKIAAEYDDESGIKKRTYREYDIMIRGGAAALAAQMGNLEKSYIGIKLDNNPDWPAVFWSVMMAGYKPLLLDYRGDAAITLHLLDTAGAVAIITDDKAEYPGYDKITPTSLLGKKLDEGFSPDWADEVALCTSGTTGTARVFVYNGDAMGHQMDNARYFLKDNGDIMYDTSDGECKNLAFLPLHHIFGFVAVYMWYSFFGKTIVYLKDKSPKTIMDTCRRHEVTHIFCVPMFWNNVTQGIMRKVAQGGERQERMFRRISRISYSTQSHAKRKGRRVMGASVFRSIQESLVGGSVRFMINGGGHILPDTLKTINTIGYPLYNGFGMTEAGITSVEFSYDICQRVKGSVGKPFESVKYKISDEGELLISGKSLYSGQMVAGEYVPRTDEWFATGDIATLRDGKLYIEGRLKEVIVDQSGENIYPDELEDYFIQMPYVTDYCVMGAKMGGDYEEVIMVMKLEEDADEKAIAALSEEILEANNALPMAKKVRHVLISDDPLPVANGIKVQRQKLRKAIEDGSWRYRELNLALQKLEGTPAEKIQTGETKKIDAAEADESFIEIKNFVRSVFADVLVLKESEIGDFDHFVNDLGGDSLAVIGVISQLEEKYSMYIPDEEFQNVVNVQEIAELIYVKLNGGEVSKPEENQEHAAASGERITDFTQTEEYKMLLDRMKREIKNPEANPYFVAHDSTVRDTSVIGGKEVINLGSYNYLGLSGHPETVEAAIDAVKKYGTSASGSRILAGEKTLYMKLEEEIADWKHTGAAIVMTGGHSTNLNFIGSFCTKGDLIIYDALSRNSITMGCQLSQAESKAFPHNDTRALEGILQSITGKFRKVLIVVEGVYSMDGDIAPIPEFIRLKQKYGAFLMVDEAHSTGVIGEHGGGVDDYFGLPGDAIDIKMGTLSKTLGTCGGYIAARKEIIDYLKYSMPGFVFTAGISPPLAAACRKSIELIRRDNALVNQLHRNIAYIIKRLKELGLDTCSAKESAIVPVMIGPDDLAFEISHELLMNGVFIPPAVFPAVPKGQSRLRLSISAAHSIEQLEEAAQTIARVCSEHGVELKPQI